MSLLIRNLLFVIVVPGTVMVWAPWRWLRLWHGAGIASALLSVPIFLIGGSIFFVCVWDFGSTGRGTPGPWDPPRNLVRRRLYSAVRNPMYLGVLLVLLAEATLFRSLLLLEYAAGVALMFHAFVFVVEEPSLRRKFGENYAQYCAATPRWIPRLRRD
jgi:protein-S-isoprenylcysteine O-methyltransferase Ste14